MYDNLKLSEIIKTQIWHKFMIQKNVAIYLNLVEQAGNRFFSAGPTYLFTRTTCSFKELIFSNCSKTEIRLTWKMYVVYVSMNFNTTSHMSPSQCQTIETIVLLHSFLSVWMAPSFFSHFLIFIPTHLFMSPNIVSLLGSIIQSLHIFSQIHILFFSQQHVLACNMEYYQSMDSDCIHI